MAQPYLGEIRIFGFPFAPRGWAFCDGQLMAVQQNTALFSLLGTSYGGNGQTTFGLPNFDNAAPMHWGSGAGLTPRVIGEVDGAATVTLNDQQIPMHTHMLFAGTIAPPNAAQVSAAPTSEAMFFTSGPQLAYSDVTTPQVQFSPQAIGVAGGSQPHDNVQPILALNFCIATSGIFPSRN